MTSYIASPCGPSVIRRAFPAEEPRISSTLVAETRSLLWQQSWFDRWYGLLLPASILLNAVTLFFVLEGSQKATFFRLDPPRLRHHLAVLPAPPSSR